MDIKNKQRIIGGLVLLAILAIFLPILFYSTRSTKSSNWTASIPSPPKKPSIVLALPTPKQAARSTPQQSLQHHSTARVVAASSQTKIISAKQPQTLSSSSNQSRNNNLASRSKLTSEKPSEKKFSTTTKQSHPIMINLNHVPKAWVVQLGTFSNQNNATRLLAKLQLNGFDAYSRRLTMKNGKSLVRVFVGPQISLSKAKAIKAKLLNQFKLSGVVRRYKL